MKTGDSPSQTRHGAVRWPESARSVIPVRPVFLLAAQQGLDGQPGFLPLFQHALDHLVVAIGAQRRIVQAGLLDHAVAVMAIEQLAHVLGQLVRHAEPFQ